MQAAAMLAAAASSRSARSGGQRSISVAPVLRFGRAQLWLGCIFFFYSCMLTLMATVSDDWIVTPSSVDNGSCVNCASWSTVRGRDVYQTRLLTAATVIAFTGYLCVALRWYVFFALYPVLKLVALGCLSAVIALDFAAYATYHNDYGASTVYANDSLYFGTGYDWSQIAGIYGSIALALLLWQEGEEFRVRRRMAELRRRREAVDAAGRSRGQSPPASPRHGPVSQPSFTAAAQGRRLSTSAFSWVSPLDRCGLVLQSARLEHDSVRLKFSLKDQLSPIQRRLVLGANVFLVLLYLGGWLISTLEGWAVQDGVNYILASWCTLGYGNYVPITTGGRLFMYAYWPVGFAVISSTSATIWRVFLFRVDRTLRKAGERLMGKRRKAARRSRGDLAQPPDTTDTAAQTGDDTEHKDRHGNAYPALTDIVFTAPDENDQPTQQQQPQQQSQQPQSQREQHRAGGGVDDGDAQPLTVTVSTPSTPSRHSHRQQQQQQQERPATQRHQQRQSPAAGFHLRTVPAPHAFDQLPPLSSVFAPLQKSTTSSSAEAAASPLSATTARSSPSAERSAAAAVPSVEPSPPPPAHDLTAPSPAVRERGSQKASGRTSSPQPEPLHVRFPSLADSGRTIPPTMLRDDFLQYLKRQTSRRQLHRDIETELEAHRQQAADGSQNEAQHAPRLQLQQEAEEEEQGRRSPSSLQSVSPRPALDSPAHHPAQAPAVSFTPFSSYMGGAALGGSKDGRRSPLFLKLSIAALCVIGWICLSGGVYVWAEEYDYSYFDCQWSAFNLLTTISVGTFATPFTTPTSTYFVWFQLIGVGTLAYTFALIAEISFLGLDDGRRARSRSSHRRRNSSNSSSLLSKPGSGQPPAAPSTAPPAATIVPASAVSSGQAAVTAGSDALVSHDANFVSHAKELDQFILELIEKQSGSLQQTADSLLQSPVLVVGTSKAQAADGKEGERVELPLEGVSLLLRYHLAFQAFEQARQDEMLQQKTRREERATRRRQRRRPQVSTEAGGDAGGSGDGLSAPEPGSAASSQQSQQLQSVPERDRQQPAAAAGGSGKPARRAAGTARHSDGDSESETSGDEEDEEDLRFDWSNTNDWIEQAEEEGEEKEEEKEQAEQGTKSKSTPGAVKAGDEAAADKEPGKQQ